MIIEELEKLNLEKAQLKEEQGLTKENENESDEDEGPAIPQSFQYLRALCAKKLGQKSERPEDRGIYKSKQQESQSEFNQQLSIQLKRSSKNLNASISSSLYQPSLKDLVPDIRVCKEPNNTTSQDYYQQASTDYKAFIQYTCPKNFNLLKNLMFAVVFKRIRKMEIKFPPHIFCEFYSLVNQILAAETYTPALEYDIGVHVNQDTTLAQGLSLSENEEIMKKLNSLSFFRRFSPETIMEYLPRLQLRYIGKAELLFAKKSQVFIITGGHLTVFDHSQQFNEPDIIAYYSEGDIIGCDDKDNKISFDPNIWFLSITRVEYLTIDETSFIDLWNIQNTIQASMNVLNFLKQIDLFEKVSQLSLYRLAFELLIERTFNSQDIIFNDGECVHKYDYIELHKEDLKQLRNLKNRLNKQIDILPLTKQYIPGFFLILDGQLKLQSQGSWQNYSLKRYNFIGENLLFPTLSISRFGQILCASQQAKCLFLSRYDFHKISSLDKEVMKQNILKSSSYSNYQKILYKFYKYYQIDNFDQEINQLDP